MQASTATQPHPSTPSAPVADGVQDASTSTAGTDSSSQILALLQEMGEVVDLRLALARTELAMLRASALRLLLWIPLLVGLLLCLLLTMVAGLGWGVMSLTGSAAWGWTAAATMQVALLLLGVLSIRRLLHEGSFPRTRAHLHATTRMLRELTAGIRS